MFRTSMNLWSLTMWTIEIMLKTTIGIIKIIYRLVLKPIFRKLYPKLRYSFIKAYRALQGFIAKLKAEHKRRARARQEQMQRCRYGRKIGNVIYLNRFGKGEEAEQAEKIERRVARD